MKARLHAAISNLVLFDVLVATAGVGDATWAVIAGAVRHQLRWQTASAVDGRSGTRNTASHWHEAIAIWLAR